MTTRLTAITVVLIAIAMAGADTALSATYTVQSCKEFDRETLPTTDWQFEPRADTFEMLADCSEAPIVLRTSFGVSTPARPSPPKS